MNFKRFHRAIREVRKLIIDAFTYTLLIFNKDN